MNQDGKIEATNSLNLEKLASTSANQHGSHDHHTTVDFYGTGSVIGEVGILGLTRGNLSVECETDVQAFFIGESDLREIMARFPSVEERLWRVSGIHNATQLLPQLPEYQVSSCMYMYMDMDMFLVVLLYL
jgi:CRP-like cAMP-binding protein